MAAMENNNGPLVAAVEQIGVPMIPVDQLLFLCHGAGADGQSFILPPNIELVHFTNPETVISYDTADAIVSTVRRIPLAADIQDRVIRLHPDQHLREQLQGHADPPGFLGRDVQVRVYPPNSRVPNLSLDLHDENAIINGMLGFYNPAISQLNMYEFIEQAGLPLSGKYNDLTDAFRGMGIITRLEHLAGFTSHVTTQAFGHGPIVRLYLICCRSGDPVDDNVLMVHQNGFGRRKRKLRDRRRTRKTSKRARRYKHTKHTKRTKQR